MVDGSVRFLARPKNSPDETSGLCAHSLKTAHRAKELAKSLGLEHTAFYAGLLHDIGKLNPWYQIFFSDNRIDSKYLQAHAIFSALAVNNLFSKDILSKRAQKQVLFAVAGHHSKLTQFTKSLVYIDHDKTRFDESHKGTYNNLDLFRQEVSDCEEFKELDWYKCFDNFLDVPQNETVFQAGNDFVSDFLDFSSVFSVLIQADRGSFFEWIQPAFDINLDTGVMVRTGSFLSDVRMSFQEYLLSENSFQDNLVILKAPTGIGKTKLFLDIVNKISSTQQFERVFYFSPLLALTDDFESKLFSTGKNVSVLNQADAEKVLTYNHAFTGNLLKKKQSKDQGLLFDDEVDDPEFLKTQEYFERESFNKQLIITTTQRLLMVLYSNKPADKEKLVSFKNSFLIIDEVQTVPKFLLPNFIALLKVIAQKYNSRILLVSATIPHELESLPKLKTSDAIEKEYLQMTIKKIDYRDDALDVSKEVALLREDERTLFMFNTRRKALAFFEQLSILKPDALYLSSGIKKRDRSETIQKSLQGRNPVTVVSTQVLEAGVDVSFSRMYREIAPLDNIVQAMGRLNREGERSDPLLTVFRVDNNYRPYSELEVGEAKKLLPNLHSSIDLYEKLPVYYKTVSDENQTYKNLVKDLCYKMKQLDFESVWDFIEEKALPDELGDSLLVPHIEEYDEIRRQLLSTDSNKGRGKLKQYAEFMAQLPGSIGKNDHLKSLLDEDLFAKGVLLPKKEFIAEVYDPKMGLDKWVKKD
ncbi:MAG: CRISPR-associated helicase Cas3' [Candidatus Bathyarchaeota archaeon]|nr:CRISPR-associated helicase Cas3' [Candidatus Termiticorpusculum sp.]